MRLEIQKKSLRLCLLVACVLWGTTSRAAPPPLPDQPIPQCFGVSVHFKDQGIEDNDAWLQKAGFGWVRRDLFWDNVETRKGVYDFTAYDKMLDVLAAHNMRVMFILDYANPLYDAGLSPHSTEGRAAFARFAATAAAHYAGRGIVWEIYNEPNLGFWTPAPDVEAYIALANETTQAIRQANPDAIIVGPALAGPEAFAPKETQELAYLDKVLSSPAVREWSAITLHPYRARSQTPESVETQIVQVRALMKQHHLDPTQTPVIAGEWGYNTQPLTGVTEERQAAYAARSLLTGVFHHMPFSFWYDWQDDGTDAFDKENRFGLLRFGTLANTQEEAMEKPAFKAIQQIASALKGYRFDRLLPAPSDSVIAHFTKDSVEEAYALWSLSSETLRVQLSVASGNWCIATLLQKQNCSVAQNLDLQLNEMPILVTPAP